MVPLAGDLLSALKASGDMGEVWEVAARSFAGQGDDRSSVVPLAVQPDGAVGGFVCRAQLSQDAFEDWTRRHGTVVHLAVLYVDSARIRSRRLERERVRLSPRERECLCWLARGLRNDRIAERMGLTKATVELHIAHARQKLRARTREHALAKAVALGLVEP